MAQLSQLGARLVRALASLKLAVIVLTALTLSLVVATSLESYYDTPTAQYWVYRSTWFHILLGLLAVNLIGVMVDRWPWKQKHLPFLLAHIGILTLLFGAWLTEQIGLDGSLRFTEGESSSTVDIDRPELVVIDSTASYRLPMPWQPPSAHFDSIPLQKHGLPYNLVVDQYISRAEPEFSFVPKGPSGDHPGLPAVQIKLMGGFMQLNQDLWLWSGDPQTRVTRMGPAWFAIGQEPEHRPNQAGLLLVPGEGGKVSFVAHTSDGKQVTGTAFGDRLGETGFPINPGWKGGLQAKILRYYPNAEPLATYKPARIQYGAQAPGSAIHVAVPGEAGQEIWLGLGDHATLYLKGGKPIDIGYTLKRANLAFQLRLERFTVDHYQGTVDPSSYASQVTLLDHGASTGTRISMNEPLTVRGLTFYQASYEAPQPNEQMAKLMPGSPELEEAMRPKTSILSVNHDPGRPLKYAGSLLLVLGAILLFGAKYRAAYIRKREADARVMAEAPAKLKRSHHG
jgi:hypothetical protein